MMWNRVSVDVDEMRHIWYSDSVGSCYILRIPFTVSEVGSCRVCWMHVSEWGYLEIISVVRVKGSNLFITRQDNTNYCIMASPCAWTRAWSSDWISLSTLLPHEVLLSAYLSKTHNNNIEHIISFACNQFTSRSSRVPTKLILQPFSSRTNK